MTDLLVARSQMAMSLAFHIIFAAVGMAMPLLMILAERKHMRTGEAVFLELARRWSRGTAILFAVGAVSGTVLSFELGLLWPQFMAFAGPIVGMPFSLEGFAFFLEAIFLGIYLYGWQRVRPAVHLLSGVMVLVSGVASAVFVVCANAWMNTPTGFTVVAGEVIEVDPLAAMFNPAAFSESLHMVLAAFAAVGFAVAGVHAAMLLRRPSLFHRKALGLALPVGCVAACLQLVSGDIAAKQVAETQPVKLAAMEGHWETERGAPLRVLGWPDEADEVTRWSIDVPKGLSFLAFGELDAEVRGLKEFPREERPPVAVVHVAFQVMVMCGMVMVAVAAVAGWLRLRRRELAEARWFLKLVVLAAPLGFIAIEAGWVVTEVGRQPWVVQSVLRTADAVTPMPHLMVPFVTFGALYLVLGVAVVVLLRRQVFAAPEDEG